MTLNDNLEFQAQHKTLRIWIVINSVVCAFLMIPIIKVAIFLVESIEGNPIRDGVIFFGIALIIFFFISWFLEWFYYKKQKYKKSKRFSIFLIIDLFLLLIGYILVMNIQLIVYLFLNR